MSCPLAGFTTPPDVALSGDDEDSDGRNHFTQKQHLHSSQSKPSRHSYTSPPRTYKERLLSRRSNQVLSDSSSESEAVGDITGTPSFDIQEYTPDKKDSSEEEEDGQSRAEEKRYENLLSGWGKDLLFCADD
jgi:hypothetical protein